MDADARPIINKSFIDSIPRNGCIGGVMYSTSSSFSGSWNCQFLFSRPFVVSSLHSNGVVVVLTLIEVVSSALPAHLSVDVLAVPEMIIVLPFSFWH